ncbi:MAG: cobalt-zinc-cadmium efflux system outer membrane protein [Roseivirga sp.]|jgi:cobalt-zinc-cadmium efflux system outer membrane protein
MRKLLIICLFGAFNLSLFSQTPLDGYLEKAASQNPTLKAKFNMYLAALEKVEQKGSLPDPTVSFGYFISPVETRVGAQRFKAGLSQMFPWRGTLPKQKQLAASLAQVKFEEFEAAKNMLFLEIKNSYLSLYELEKQLEINATNLELLKSFEPISKTKYESNLASLADLVRVQIKIDEASTQLELLKLKREPLLSDFNTLLNNEIPISIDQIDLTFELNTEKEVDFTLDSAVQNNPSIRAVQEQISSTNYQVELAELASKPKIGLGLEYGFIQKRDMPNIPDNGKDILAPTISLSLPIFRKKNEALKQEAGFMQEAYKNQIEAVQNQITNQWVMANFQFEKANTELRLYDKELEKTELLLKLLTTDYSNNNTQFDQLLSTLQLILQLKLSALTASVNLQESLFNFNFLTGTTLTQFR